MVLDRNDSPPHFQNGPYIISLSEDAPVGSTVAILQADDPDLEGSVRFSISESQADSGRFQVNPQSGTLVLVEPLDREQQSQHQFFVTATDGLQSEEALVTIEVSSMSFDLWLLTKQLNETELLYLQDDKFDPGQDSCSLAWACYGSILRSTTHGLD